MVTVSPSEPWAYALQLPHDPRAPRIARVTLRAVLHSHGMGELIEMAELLSCEMVTNAYRHSNGPSSLRLRGLGEGRLRVSVWDTNPVILPPFDKPPGALRPVPDLEPTSSDCGRGLLPVQLCADNWGGYPLGEALSVRAASCFGSSSGPSCRGRRPQRESHGQAAGPDRRRVWV